MYSYSIYFPQDFHVFGILKIILHNTMLYRYYISYYDIEIFIF